MVTDRDIERIFRILRLNATHAGFTAGDNTTNHTAFMHANSMFNFSMHDFYRIVVAETTEWFPMTIELPLILAYACLITIGVTANIIICTIIARNKRLRTARNVYIINLSVADAAMCVICVPFTLVKLLRKNWTLGSSMCKLIPGFQAMNVFTSTLTTVAIALDRYYAIVYPTRFTCNDRLSGSISATVILWIMSFFMASPLFLFNQLHRAKYIEDLIEHTICMEIWPNLVSKTIYTSIMMVLQFFLPLVALLVIHWKICKFLRMRMINDPKTQAEMLRAERESVRTRKNTTLLVAIAMAFAISWFPLTLLNVLADFDYRILLHKDFNLACAICHIIAMSTSVTNPVIYGWMNPNFRRDFLRMLCFCMKDTTKGFDTLDEVEQNKVDCQKHSTYNALGETKCFPTQNTTTTNDFLNSSPNLKSPTLSWCPSHQDQDAVIEEVTE